MMVELYKKTGKYVDKDGNERNFTNFSILCGDELVPIEVKFFEGDDGKDYRYSGRKSVVSAFASPLPDKQSD